MKKIYFTLQTTLLVLVAVCLSKESIGNTQPTRLSRMANDPHEYFVSQVIPVSRKEDGLEGKIKLMLDKRLKGRKNPGKKEDSRKDDAAGYHPAILKLFGIDGKEVDGWAIDNAFVSIKRENKLKNKGRSLFRIVEDNNALYGGCTGLNTSFIVINNNRLEYLRAKSRETGEVKAIDLVESSYNYWKFVPSKSKNGLDIIAGQVDPKNLKRITWVHYFFDGNGWVSKIKTKISEKKLADEMTFNQMARDLKDF